MLKYFEQEQKKTFPVLYQNEQVGNIEIRSRWLQLDEWFLTKEHFSLRHYLKHELQKP